jgi:cytochrome P450
MRITDPVHIEEQYNLCELFRYKDIQYVLSNTDLFSSEHHSLAEGELKGMIVYMDPPRHGALRGLISPAFTPRATAQLTEQIHVIVSNLLDTFDGDEQIDIITELAYPLPTIVLTEMLGVPLEKYDQFKSWSDALHGTSIENTASAMTALQDYFRTIVQQKCHYPQKDLISDLLAAQLQGDSLSEDEVIGFCILLLEAGTVATTNLIGNLMLCLDQYPEARAQLWADPSLLPSAIEETMRFCPPLPRLTRIAKHDIEIGKKQLKTGQTLFLWIASANRDEDQFLDPDVFNMTRTPNRHLGFGSGIHFCLGAFLARLEVKILFEAMIGRFTDIQRVQDVLLEQPSSYATHGVEHLPVRLRKH